MRQWIINVSNWNVILAFAALIADSIASYLYRLKSYFASYFFSLCIIQILNCAIPNSIALTKGDIN
jgi:hypothetical protein